MKDVCIYGIPSDNLTSCAFYSCSWKNEWANDGELTGGPRRQVDWDVLHF